MTDAPGSAPKVPGLTGLTVLARGGYATVYRAEQESVGRDVAVKVENRTLENERDRRRFLREARAAGRMSSHPHVVDLFDAGVTADGHPYLIMEMCEGSYAERMRTNPLSAVEARDVGVKIADALADAHSLGVLHRDVKPANILVSRFGEPALADFGLAILAESRDTSITLDILTPAYAPPETFRYAPPGPAADVYALCATLYALMHGRPPRWHDDRTPGLASLVDMFAQPLPDLPGVPPEMMALLRAGMSSDEHARPSAAAVRDALMALHLEPGGAPPTGGPPPTDGGGPPPPAGPPSRGGPVAPGGAPPPDEQPTEPNRRVFALGGRLSAWLAGWWHTGWLAVGTGLLALALVAAGIWYAIGHRGPAAPGPLAGGSATPTTAAPTPTSGPILQTGVACVLTGSRGRLRCVAAPECYEALTPRAGVTTATQIPCERPHPWEVFAVDQLPPEVQAVDQATMKANAYVRSACNPGNAALLELSAFNWRTEVLPPTPDAFRAGDRTFRCLAGSPAGLSTGAVFARPPR